MDRLDGLLGNMSGSKDGEPSSGGPRKEPRVNFKDQKNRRKTYDPLEVVHQAMPQGIIEHGAQTSEEVQLAADRPQKNDRPKAHM